METIRILLADDHTVVRQGLRRLLEAEPDISVVGEAGTGREAVHLTRKLRPDVVVMDIAMPRLNGLEAARQIARAMPGARVLVLSSYSDDEYIRRLTEIGAAGYLLKQTAAADLIRAVREAKRGRTFFSPAVSRRLLEHSRGFSEAGRSAPPRPHRLTPREAEVLQLIAEGQPNKGIAAELSISIKTVQKHRQRVMDKLHLHETASLTRYAIARGMVEKNPLLRIG